MARLTLRLPESLHDAITSLAEREGVSVNHFVVYALTQATAAELATRQRAEFDRMLTRVSPDVAEAALSELLATRTEAPASAKRRRREAAT